MDAPIEGRLPLTALTGATRQSLGNVTAQRTVKNRGF